MKRFRVMTSIFSVVILLLIIMPVHSNADMVKVKGCVYNKKTGAKISSPFVVRIWNRNGNGIASSGVNGCYDGIELDNLSSDWDFIEVIVKQYGRFYTQQYKLPPAYLDSGMDFLGLPSGVVRYDFYVDIIERRTMPIR
jgi:hypothetical protein